MSVIFRGTYADVEFSDGSSTIIKLGDIDVKMIYGMVELMKIIQKKVHISKVNKMAKVSIYATDKRTHGEMITQVIRK